MPPASDGVQRFAWNAGGKRARLDQGPTSTNMRRACFSVVPIVFWDKQSALEGACVLMRTRISASNVEGRQFLMHRTALVAYYQSRCNREQKR
jgi:hypothetical protein